MNVPKIDFFSLLSTAAAILSAYSAWKSYKTSKRLEEIQDLRLDIVVKDVTYENIPDGHWQHIQFQITNLSTVAALIKKMSIFFHGRTHELSFDGSPILIKPSPIFTSELFLALPLLEVSKTQRLVLGVLQRR